MNFSERLKELRLEFGITQQDLANVIGITEGAVRKYENNSGKPRNSNLEQLAKFFNVSVSYLLGETNIRSANKINELMEHLSEPSQERVISFAQKLFEEEKNRTP